MMQYEEIPKDDIKDLLAKGWLTHDSMWLFNAYNTVGFENGNIINRAAVKSMVPIEIERVKKILNYDYDSKDIEGLRDFLINALKLLLPASLIGSLVLSIRGNDRFFWKWEEGQCFAYKGLKRINMIENYKCAVMYRIECWFNALGIDYEINPRIDGCIMHTEGRCTGEIIIRNQ